MAVKRIKPNIRSDDFAGSRRFYNELIGLDGGDGLDWILFFGGESREVQLSVMGRDIHAGVHPDVSIEVDDVDDVHARCVAAGAEISTRSPTSPGGCGGSSSETRTARSSTSPSTTSSRRGDNPPCSHGTGRACSRNGPDASSGLSLIPFVRLAGSGRLSQRT